jgi:hypothetical protein
MNAVTVALMDEEPAIVPERSRLRCRAPACVHGHRIAVALLAPALCSVSWRCQVLVVAAFCFGSTGAVSAIGCGFEQNHVLS